MSNIEERLKVIESALSEFYGKSDTYIGSLIEEIESYNDPSRDPYGSYEVGMALNEGEQPHCESLGFKWKDWQEVKQLMGDYEYLLYKFNNMETYLKTNHPDILDTIDNLI
jgi:hypothetical protein